MTVNFHVLHRSGFIDYDLQSNYPGQPRDKLGRWAGKGASSGSFASVTDKKEMRELKKEISEWGGERGKIGKKAITEHSPPDSDLQIFKSEGKTKAVFLTESDGSTRYIHYLATAEKGYGTTMMRTVAAKAASAKEGLMLSATPSSASFYKALGFKQGRGEDSDLFTLSKAATKKFAASGKHYLQTNLSDKELSKLEPDDGVFAVRRRS